MRILHVCPYFHPAVSFGGVASFTFNIVSELRRRGHDVVVYTSDAGGKNLRVLPEVVQGIHSFPVKRFRGLVPGSIAGLFVTPGLVRYVGGEIPRFDLVHLHEYRTFQNVVVGSAAKKSSIPYVLQAHGTLPRIGGMVFSKRLFDTLFGDRILRHASGVIAMNRFEMGQIESGHPDLGGALGVIPNTVDLTSIDNAKIGKRFRGRFGIDDEARLIMYLGRLHPIKGVDVLLRAFSMVASEVKDVVLVVAGPNDGALSFLSSLAESLSVGNRVLFTGLLSFEDKIGALMASEFLVVPSRYELFATVILEAFACEKPVIASAIGGLPEVVIDGKSGLLFEPGNDVQLAQRIRDLLQDRDSLKAMGKQARDLACDVYAVEKVADTLEAYYGDVLAR